MGNAKLNEDVLRKILKKFEEEGVVRENSSRHKEQAYHHHKTVFNLNKENIKEKDNIQLLFDIVITRRARALRSNNEDQREDDSRPTYKDLSDAFDYKKIIEASGRNEAFDYLVKRLLNVPNQINQKIANEFLRVYIHVFEAEDWVDELDVPLDTHVLQALVRTGALERSGYDYQDTGRMVNTNTDSGTRTRISYSDLQEAFKNADPNYPGIVFDELWLENSIFLSSQNKALQRKSSLYDIIR